MKQVMLLKVKRGGGGGGKRCINKEVTTNYGKKGGRR